MTGIRPLACLREWCESFCGCRAAVKTQREARLTVMWSGQAAGRRSLRQSGDVRCHFCCISDAGGKVDSVKGKTEAVCVGWSDGLLRGWRVNRTTTILRRKAKPGRARRVEIHVCGRMAYRKREGVCFLSISISKSEW